MLSDEIRRRYLGFFEKRGHKIIESASLIPDDQTTLFVSSGMQPLVPYLMGKPHFLGKRLTNSQKCFRADDIEEVGDGRHTTFFEMLGNWSLGDYFKEEQLAWIFEFLVDEIGLDIDRLYVSVFSGNEKMKIKRDTQSVKIWQNLFKKRGIVAQVVDMSIQEEKKCSAMTQDNNQRIFLYPETKNWWSRSGIPSNMPIGEIGGSDSEIFYDLGEELNLHQKSQWATESCHINCDCGRFIEIGNSVFIQYIKTKNGFEELKNKNIDFGGGLERIAMASQNKSNVFEIDLLAPASQELEKLSGKSFCENKRFFEVIIDHLRAIVFILGDKNGEVGIPSNTGQGYLTRRLIRRAIRSSRQLGINAVDLPNVVNAIIDKYLLTYPEIKQNKEFILRELNKEIKKFSQTLQKGEQEFEKMIIKNMGKLKGVDVFNLYQTYGFPIEIICEMAEEKKISLDLQEFEKEKEKHRNLSKASGAKIFKGGLGDQKKETVEFHTMTHLLLSALKRILGEDIEQKGSNITAERLRFDFNYKEKLSDEQKEKIENLVNSWIKAGGRVELEEMPIEQAKKEGATGVFESKYNETVKVYTIISRDGEVISKEICGGPHIKNIKELGIFKIKKEQSASAGIRRIKAINSKLKNW